MYMASPEYMASFARKFIHAGASLIGAPYILRRAEAAVAGKVLRIASGEPITFGQDEISRRGQTPWSVTHTTLLRPRSRCRSKCAGPDVGAGRR